MEKKYTLYITDDILTNYPIASSKSLETVYSLAVSMGYIFRDEDEEVIRFIKQYLDEGGKSRNATWYAYIRK